MGLITFRVGTLGSFFWEQLSEGVNFLGRICLELCLFWEMEGSFLGEFFGRQLSGVIFLGVDMLEEFFREVVFQGGVFTEPFVST